jgi:hypothetical protein
MKSLILFSVFLFFVAGSATAQKVVSANGGTATAAGVEVSWTIGEPITETVTDGTTTLTQGFQQSKLTVTAINDIQISGVEIKVYPNPTSDYVTVHFSKAMEKPTYLLFDLSGRLIEQKNIETTDAKIDMTGYAGGSYILKLNSGQQPLQSFKIIKR